MKHKLLPLLLLVFPMVLGGCGPVGPTTSNQTDTQESTTHTEEKPEWIDYAHDGGVTLTHDYKDRDFYKDGIGQVKLRTCIDGDTAHFEPYITTTKSENIKSRFFGIDTPESTGKVQPWGKKASNFTKAKLKEADKNGTIVVSSPFNDYHLPEPDSTGERYVSLIWISLDTKDAPFEELTLLNLWIVQEGLSWVKNVLAMPELEDVFYAAQAQAEAYKLNVHSDEVDPDFPSDEYMVASLLDLKRDNETYLKNGAKADGCLYNEQRVAITGTVAGFSNHILYLTDYFDEETSGTKGGEYAGINIFCGMSPVPTKYTTKNTYIQIFGLVQITDNFGFQLTDVEGRFPAAVSYDDADTKILLKPNENVGEHELHEFNYTPSELTKVINDKNYESLNCFVNVTEPVKVIDTFIKSNDEITLTFASNSFGCYITFTYKGDPDKNNWVWTQESEFNNQEFMVKGILTYHKTMSGKIKFQINPNSSADLIWLGKDK